MCSYTSRETFILAFWKYLYKYLFNDWSILFTTLNFMKREIGFQHSVQAHFIFMLSNSCQWHWQKRCSAHYSHIHLFRSAMHQNLKSKTDMLSVSDRRTHPWKSRAKNVLLVRLSASESKFRKTTCFKVDKVLNNTLFKRHSEKKCKLSSSKKQKYKLDCY